MNKIKILMARNFTLEPLIDEIQEKLKKKNIKAEFMFSGYEDSVAEFLNKESKFYKFKPDLILIFYILDVFLGKKIKSLNIKLPEPKAPVGAYVASKIVGKLLYISGQISIDENAKLITGKIGKDLDLDKGYKAAERCGLSIVAHVKNACGGDLNKVKSCIKLTGYVNSTDDFKEQPKIINGASDIIAKIFGNKGEHTRAAVSVNSLPLGVAVEVDAIFELN